jgi:hypothetical protein
VTDYAELHRSRNRGMVHPEKKLCTALVEGTSAENEANHPQTDATFPELNVASPNFAHA